jgi:hypothetical protein
MTFDPLEQLIRTADGADTPQPPADLAQRVRRRAEQQQRQARAIRLSAGTVAVLIAAVISIRGLVGLRQSSAPPLDASQIARLRSEADEFGARANAMQRQIDRLRSELARQELREEYARLSAAARDEDVGQTAIDRAASIAVTEGDFLWEVRHDRADARAAYERTLSNFPESQWATVARERIEQLNMN